MPQSQGGSSGGWGGGWVPARSGFSPPAWPNSPQGPRKSGEPQCAEGPECGSSLVLPPEGPRVLGPGPLWYLYSLPLPPALASAFSTKFQHQGEGAAVCISGPHSPVGEVLLWQSCLPAFLACLFQSLGWGARLPGACSLALLPWFTGAGATAALRGRVAARMKGAWLLGTFWL